MKKIDSHRALYGRALLLSLCLLLIAFSGIYYFSTPKDSQAEFYEKMAALSPEELKKAPKYDRPDLALLHEFEMTKDPSLGYIPSERKIEAFEQVHKIIARQKNQKAIDNVNWDERGPDNVGGRTRALMFDPNDGSAQKVWAGGVAGGLWYNNNITSSTSQWTSVNDFWANLAISTIAYDPSNTQNFYVGTGEGFYNADAVRGGGIWKSSDGGSSWSQLSSTNNSNFYYVQKIAVTSAGTILAATREGLFRSTDGGASWTEELSGRMADIEVTSNSSIYVSKGIRDTGIVYKSTDDGVSYTNVTPASGAERIELASAPSDGNVVYAVAASGSSITWFRKTTNGGSSWTSVTIPKYLTQSCSASSSDFTRSQAWYDLILAVHPTNSNIVLAGGIDIHRSTNGGSSWSSVSYWTGSCAPYVHADQHAMAFRPGFADQAIFGNDGGVSYSSNVGSASNPSFSDRNKGYNVTQFYAVAAANTSGSNYFLAGAQDNGSQKFTTSGINSTSQATGGDGAFCHIDQDNSNYQITSYVFNSYYRSTNGGASFSSIGSDQGRGRFINPTDYDDSANKLYAAGNANELVRYDNITGSVSKNIVSVSIGSGKISAVKVSPHTANRVFVATGGGDIYRIDNAHTNSPTVTNIGSTSFPDAYISCVNIGSSDSQVIVIFSSYGVTSVWETRNAGSSWANKEGNLPDMPIRWALYNPDNTDQVLLATELGVWSVDDINVSSPVWAVSNTGLANVRCDMLQYRSADKLVVLATHGRGVFTSDVFSSTTPPAGCTTTISSFPYQESFESGLGSWTQATGDDIDWTRQSGSTPSSNTGPTAADDGSYYMYVESSSPNYPSKAATFVSPCFDISSLTDPELNFDYHMYGAAMGSLTLQVSTDDGATWANLWTLSGDQGNAWGSASVDLSAYSGTIQLKYNGVTGSNYTGDMSVDNIRLAAGTTSTCTAISSFPYEESFESGIGSWTQASGDDIDWTRQSGGTPSSNTGPAAADDGSYYMYVEASSPNYPSKVANLLSPCFDISSLTNPSLTFSYHMYGAAMGTLNVQVSTDNGATWTTEWTRSGEQSNVWNDASVDLSAYSGTVRIRLNGTTGSNYTSDISVDKIVVSSGTTTPGCTAVSSFPYEESYESGLGSWVQDSGDNIDWTRQSGSTPSSNTGPSAAADGSYYMYVESSSPNYPSKVANLLSPCFDISSLSTPTFSFNYHMYGSAMGTLNVQVSTDNGTSWTTAWAKSGDQGNSWSSASVDLSAYSGTISIRFNGTTGSNYTGDMSVDKIRLGEGTTSITYCASQGNSTTDEWIQRVRVGSIDNNSGSNSGYVDFTSISTDLAKSSSYTITINPAWAGTIYSEGYAVWIDYNQNGDFTDSGELVYSAGASTNSTVSGTFTVPASALSGTTRMRVSMRYNAIPTSCGSFNYGEVEDYAVNITSSGTAVESAAAPIAESVADVKLHAYPNPLQATLNVDLQGFEDVVNVRLLNSAGKEIVGIQTSEKSVSLDVNHLRPGIYVLLAEDNSRTTKQLVFKD